MLRAVLFDWSGTLVDFSWDDELLAAGHRAGLAALDRESDAEAFTARFRDQLQPALRPGDDYHALLQRELDAGDEDVDRFLDAEYAVWTPAHALLSSAHALLESLRVRGLRLGIVANGWPEPARLTRRRLSELGVADRVDAIVLADEVGVRKPDPRIFEAALDRLGVDAAESAHVGDRLDHDVAGAANAGLTTVQAVWFNADERQVDVEPDFVAFTPMDVLNVTRRLALAGA
ncbi:MAG TPA: HAD family hydrolase [Gaiellaceae bacterium]|nr:HAD family hydrolase [Gaiellaceae bacterium]